MGNLGVWERNLNLITIQVFGIMFFLIQYTGVQKNTSLGEEASEEKGRIVD